MKLPVQNLGEPPQALRFTARHSGVALVATLIMLSLVTFMVVAFLSVARRERRSVEVSIAQNESRRAMDAALAVVQGEILSRLLLTGDKWNYGVIVPTNWQNVVFNATANPTNVNHTNALAQGLNAWLTNLANLQYDPFVPVYSTYYTNTRAFALPIAASALLSETNLGRYYLDFNRNGIFDSTDRNHVGDPHWIGILEYPHLPHGPTNRFVGRYTYIAAPVGKTMDLNYIHNQAKRLITAPVGTAEGYSRNLGLGSHEFNLAALLTELAPNHYGYAYNTLLATPSTFIPAARDAFRDAKLLLNFRNNSNYNNHATLTMAFGVTPATYLTNGLFDVLGNGPLMASTNLLANADSAIFVWPGGSNANASARHYFDFTELFSAARPDYTPFTTNLHFLSTNLVAFPAVPALAADADRRTAYRMMEVLGTESWPVTNKLNVNWPNTLNGSAGGETFGFTNWHPDTFFFSAAELMLRASFTPSVFINTNWNGHIPIPALPETNVLVTNYYFGTTFLGTNVDFNSLSLTNIPIFPINYYLPEVHRLLQFTANIFDATGPPEWLITHTYAAGDRVQRGFVNYVAVNPSTGSLPPSANWETVTGAFLPTVWRPIFGFNSNGFPTADFIRVVGYTTNGTDANTLLSLPTVDLSDPNSRMQMYTAAANALGASNLCHVGGMPVIIGARKGYPNFNEFGVQTIFSDTRRLEFVKASATNAGPMAPAGVARPVQTNQSIIIGMTNIYGFEAWNSYAQAFPRPLLLLATNIAQIVITNQFGPVYTNTTTNGVSQSFAANAWLGTANGFAAFKGFFFTNVPQLAAIAARGYAYGTNYPPLAGFTNGGFIPASPSGPASPSIFNRSNGFPEMRLGITITNSIRFALVDSNRVVDFVNLSGLVAGMDLATALRVTNSPADTGVNYWFTNRAGPTVFDRTLGISNQVALCLDTNVNAQSTNLWRQYSLNTPILREIDRFRKWMGTNGPLPANQSLNTNILSIQSPFNPTRVIAFNTTWEANDPLVHYTTRDLSDPFRTSIGDQVTPIIPPTTVVPPPGTLARVDFGFVNGRLTFATNGGINRFYNPWGRMLDPTGTRLASLPSFYTVAPAAFDQRLKDAGIHNSDQWDFPQRKFANLGWIGRVHRGTPWQTFYLKSDIPNPTNWFYWARSVDTNPTNDWRLVDVFSAAINADATRGLLSVNQTNSAAWAAGLGGLLVLSNNGVVITPLVLTPATTQLTNIVGGLTNGLINAKLRIPLWQPALNYSFGDVVGYFNGAFGFVNYYVALNGTNQNQNPYTQVTVSNNVGFNYWTNIPPWAVAGIYSVGTIVERFGVSYYALRGTPAGPPEAVPADWELYQQRSFIRTGSVLSTPELSVQSPYLNSGRTWQFNTAYVTGNRVHWQGWYYQAIRNAPLNTPPNPHINYSDPRSMAQAYWWPLESPLIARNPLTVDALNDVFVERIPQQTLGLMHLESSPRFVVDALGQSLRPAERGTYVVSGAFAGMITNYQITGESAGKAIFRIDGLTDPGSIPRPLPAGAPPVVQPRVIFESFKLVPAEN